jgi:predicted nucleic acid-binding protein
LTNYEKNTKLKEVLDTRFLREIFYPSQKESTQKLTRKLQALINANEGILPTVVIAEITQITCALRGKDMARSRSQSLIQSGLDVQPLTSQIAEQAGLLKCQYSNLPMGDCIIAATALVNHARVLSDDPHFDCIEGLKRVWL